MKLNVLKSLTGSAARVATSVVRMTALDALLGATCGALFGMVFGGFGAVIHHDTLRIILIIGNCALAGLVLGALTGAMRSAMNGLNRTNSESRPDNVFGNGASIVRGGVHSSAKAGSLIQSPAKVIPIKVGPRVTAIAG